MLIYSIGELLIHKIIPVRVLDIYKDNLNNKIFNFTVFYCNSLSVQTLFF